jgi:signal transduction histidine kinase
MPQEKIDILTAILSTSIFLLLIIAAAFLIFRIYLKKKRSFIEEKEGMKIIFEKAILQSQVEIQEQTLQTISQEIHDNIGQTLSLVKLNLNTINLANENAEEKINFSKELVSKAITDLRILSKTLNKDSILSTGLLKALDNELQLVKRSTEMKISLTTSGNIYKLDGKIELILFRIIQEGLNNIIKHSNASIILIHAGYLPNELQVIIKDDGNGFDVLPGGGYKEQGSGLLNMKNRAELIGGMFEIVSSIQGTTITITAPNNNYED